VRRHVTAHHGSPPPGVAPGAPAPARPTTVSQIQQASVACFSTDSAVAGHAMSKLCLLIVQGF
jgi:hypothetical protein